MNDFDNDQQSTTANNYIIPTANQVREDRPSNTNYDWDLRQQVEWLPIEYVSKAVRFHFQKLLAHVRIYAIKLREVYLSELPANNVSLSYLFWSSGCPAVDRQASEWRIGCLSDITTSSRKLPIFNFWNRSYLWSAWNFDLLIPACLAASHK